ncbi:tetratricopeptide repeat domain protein [Desulfosarcina variabilis str. Montpellier]|uniref:tetratricopeptide repeat protein n=1 Tax=Desulfosarcina variabilis TaxID=2300 RepID=UPI003AFA6BB7
MNVNLWQILCFLAVIIGATIVVFPTQRSMLPHLIDNGKYAAAGIIIEKLLNKTHRDGSVVDQSVRLYLLQGHPEKAIDCLETLHRQAPLTAERFEQLARLYEWNRQPAKAQDTWKRLLSIAPDHPAALKRLIGYYRYNGDLTRESTTIGQLVRLQGTLGRWQDNGKRLTDLIAVQISRLEPVLTQPSVPPLTAMLASGLYQLYEKELAEPSMQATTSDQAAMHRCLEQFVWTGHLADGQAFAARADQLWDTGIDQQMRLVDVLRWAQMDQEALALLEQLHQEAPENRRVLVAMAETAKLADNAAAGIAAYQALIRMAPSKPGYRQQLMSLYQETSQTASLFDEYERQLHATGDARLIDQLFKLARQSGDPKLQQRALDLAARTDADDSELLKQQADLYLAMDQPGKAYPLLKRIATGPDGSAADLKAMIQVAGYTGKPALLGDALQTGIALAPQDADLTLRLARLHLAQSRQPQAIDAFKRYLEIKPDDVKVQKELAQVYEWQGQPQQALAIYRQVVRDHPEDASATTTLARLMAETGDQAGLIALAIQKADAAPQNADLALAAGRALVAEGQLEKGALYLKRAAALAPGQSVVWRELANVYQWTGESDRLIDALEHLAATGGLDQRQTLLLAESYSNRRRWADVVTLLVPVENQRVLPRREGLKLVDAYMQTGRQAQALDLIQRLFDENRNDPVFLADLGQRAQWQQRLNLALLVYEAVLQKDPVNLKALKGSGQIYAWTHAPKPAIKALETYNRLYPHDYETQYLLGELYMAAHRDADAQKQYRKAMRLINSGRREDGADPPVQEPARP